MSRPELGAELSVVSPRLGSVQCAVVLWVVCLELSGLRAPFLSSWSDRREWGTESQKDEGRKRNNGWSTITLVLVQGYSEQ